MKRLALILSLLLLATAAFAAEADRSDLLITPDGTVFNIASEVSRDGIHASLKLTVESGDTITNTTLPTTNDNLSFNSHPALAYDVDSKTLFAFWQRSATIESPQSELLVASFNVKKGWERPVSVDSQLSTRYNLNVAITHHVQQLDRDGVTYLTVPAIVLHAAWWEESSEGHGARYAVMGLRGGAIVDPDVHSTFEFVTERPTDRPTYSTDEVQLDGNLARHVALLESPTPDAVDLLFADPRTNSFYRTTLRPILDGRLHIIPGVRGGNPRLGGPHLRSIDWSGTTGTMTSHDGKMLILYNVGAEKVTYLSVIDGTWSDPAQATLSEKLSAASAIHALGNMLTSAAQK